MVELHHDAVSGSHMHIKDSFKYIYDKNLKNLTKKLKRENPTWSEKKVRGEAGRLPEGHISIEEFVNLNVRCDFE